MDQGSLEQLNKKQTFLPQSGQTISEAETNQKAKNSVKNAAPSLVSGAGGQPRPKHKRPHSALSRSGSSEPPNVPTNSMVTASTDETAERCSLGVGSKSMHDSTRDEGPRKPHPLTTDAHSTISVETLKFSTPKVRFARSRLLAPILVTLLRCVILGCLIVVNRTIVRLQDQFFYNATFWGVSILTQLLYYRTSLGDPGFQRECPSQWIGESGRAQLLGERLSRQERERQKATRRMIVARVMRSRRNHQEVSSSEEDGRPADSDEDDENDAVVDFGRNDGSLAGGFLVKTSSQQGQTNKADPPPSDATEVRSASTVTTVGSTLTNSTLPSPVTATVPPEVVGFASPMDDPSRTCPEKSPLCSGMSFHESGVQQKRRNTDSFGISITGKVDPQQGPAEKDVTTSTNLFGGWRCLGASLICFAPKLWKWLLFSTARLAIVCLKWQLEWAQRLWLRWRYLVDYQSSACRTEEERARINDTQLPPSQLFQLRASAMYQCNQRLHYCDECHIWKPLRTKHCRACGFCVRMHDHHCPWLGVCVGEGNRVLFVHFLFWQTLEILWTIFEIVATIMFRDLRWADPNFAKGHDLEVILPRVALLILSLVICCIAIMTVCLWGFHLLLILTNLTTWETVSWSRISYLKYKEPGNGSPFTTAKCSENWDIAMLPLNKKLPVGVLAERVSLGPNAELLWKAKHADSPDYKQAPCKNGFCSVYDLFI